MSGACDCFNQFSRAGQVGCRYEMTVMGYVKSGNLVNMKSLSTGEGRRDDRATMQSASASFLLPLLVPEFGLLTFFVSANVTSLLP